MFFVFAPVFFFWGGGNLSLLESSGHIFPSVLVSKWKMSSFMASEDGFDVPCAPNPPKKDEPPRYVLC